MITFDLEWEQYRLHLGMQSLKEVKVLEIETKYRTPVSELEFSTVKELIEKTYLLFNEMIQLFEHQMAIKEGRKPKQLSFLKD